ncbi:Gfo/Idh/MocA family oxidoreductase [Pseudovibrio sp. Tun.PSC04-5.I4]|uniref:Gfo/Idh/MocA family protein n=1 Tax=Pseudovibrio sp. Tun.PSC04-5.I4 TaxID=1798213 RepID=UPI00087E76E0|nr:Gfo/Idh/MocA family oxidoreductase [Pseudovibrio sp. Tun.PSC04-5.I4]SDQ16927.1 Predicted dehydrogenase [Pseudovibrio sp. Tun.PSC04-5.I4]
MTGSLSFAVIGVDHRHIYGMAEGMIAQGCTFKSFWTEGDPQPMEGFTKRFPDVPRVQDHQEILEDDSVALILIAAPPDQRAALAIEAMQHGKDVMLDKPGCVTLEEFSQIRAAVEQTGRIWSIDFSERFEVRAVTKAAELVHSGRIGEVLQTVGMGPHRLNKQMRPDWFFEEKRYGGILSDIATHQIDQFLYLTGAESARVVHSAVGNFGNPDHPEFQDFGELNLVSGRTQAYIRLDWFTPDGLPNWGDGRLFILGTEGYIELRKYVDVCGRPGQDHLFLVNGQTCEYIECSDAELPYFKNLAEDVRNRTYTACPQQHTFTVTELALTAQLIAERRGYLEK